MIMWTFRMPVWENGWWWFRSEPKPPPHTIEEAYAEFISVQATAKKFKKLYGDSAYVGDILTLPMTEEQEAHCMTEIMVEKIDVKVKDKELHPEHFKGMYGVETYEEAIAQTKYRKGKLFPDA